MYKMVHCAICGKEFPTDDALIFFDHFIKEHKDELKKTQKEIVKGKHNDKINNPETFKEQEEISKELSLRLKSLENKNLKRLK
jgi:hypothetical protein